MKQIHLDALPDDEVFFLSNNSRGIGKGVVTQVKLLNNGGVEYTIRDGGDLHWSGIVGSTKEELVAKFNVISAEC